MSRSPAGRRGLAKLERTAVRAATGFVNGIEWLQRDPADVVDRTPYDVVGRRSLVTLRHYRPLVHDEDLEIGRTTVRIEAPRRPVPVLLIPPLMVQPWIYDLAPRRSLVRTFLRAGFDVVLLDFGAPGKEHQNVTLDDYVLDWVPFAIDRTLEISQSADLALLGYCQGGLFALFHTAVHKDPRVRAIITIGSPIDAQKMSLLNVFVRYGHAQIDAISRRLGNVPGGLSATAFRMTNPIGSVTRYSDLFLNLWNDDFVNGFDGVTAWTSHFVDYPGDAFRQLLGDFVKDNKLMQGTMQFGDKTANLRDITCPVLAFAGKTDKIVPPAAAREVLGVLGTSDTTFREVPGGHMGVMAGRHAPTQVWAYAAEWLKERLG
ncbi:MAG: alpha/beta fold hydrolase [Deltaproteobacteria bacterium]|nr:alpha/beta fold hydrolase [Deltaproteobacteria bacterium]